MDVQVLLCSDLTYLCVCVCVCSYTKSGPHTSPTHVFSHNSHTVVTQTYTHILSSTHTVLFKMSTHTQLSHRLPDTVSHNTHTTAHNYILLLTPTLILAYKKLTQYSHTAHQQIVKHIYTLLDTDTVLHNTHIY